MSANLNKAIAYCMHAIKKAKGGDPAELRRAMLYFNSARNMVKAEDTQLASTLLNKAVEILQSLETVDEAAIPADRLARASASNTTSAQQRNDWLGGGRRRETGFAAAEPAAPQAAAAAPSRPVFGKRR